jgi:hypothetical protein
MSVGTFLPINASAFTPDGAPTVFWLTFTRLSSS